MNYEKQGLRLGSVIQCPKGVGFGVARSGWSEVGGGGEIVPALLVEEAFKEGLVGGGVAGEIEMGEVRGGGLSGGAMGGGELQAGKEVEGAGVVRVGG